MANRKWIGHIVRPPTPHLRGAAPHRCTGHTSRQIMGLCWALFTGEWKISAERLRQEKSGGPGVMHVSAGVPGVHLCSGATGPGGAMHQWPCRLAGPGEWAPMAQTSEL